MLSLSGTQVTDLGPRSRWKGPVVVAAIALTVVGALVGGFAFWRWYRTLHHGRVIEDESPLSSVTVSFAV